MGSNTGTITREVSDMARKSLGIILAAWLLATAGLLSTPARSLAMGNEDNGDYYATPPFITTVAPPLVLIVMGRDHKLYFEAYDDHSDLDGDGVLDVGYKPATINYYGYFDCDSCYTYNSSGYFQYSAPATDKKCTNAWSGDFLNYLTMSRMDCLRKVLYGGYRSTDTNTDTILERAYVTEDAHSWGKEYTSYAVDGYYITDYTPLAQPNSGKRHLLGTAAFSQDGPPELVTLQNSSYRIWDWASKERPVLDTSLGAYSSRYTIRLKVPQMDAPGVARYPGPNGELGDEDDVFKPVGLLQRYSKDPQKMYFALVTGSYTNNLQGGILRSKAHFIEDTTDPAHEVDPQYGTIINTTGIIKTIDKLKIKGYCYCNSGCSNGKDYTWIDDPTNSCNCTTICGSSFGEGNCGSIAYQPCPNGYCNMWGNPIAEMMYEGLRYLAGQTSPTGEYTTGVTASSTYDYKLGLPAVTSWTGINPYNNSGTQVPWCGQPFMLVVSDVNPSFDSDQLPGARFQWDTSTTNKGYLGTGTWNNSSLTARGETSTPQLNVATEMTAISGASGENISGSYYIGQSGTNYDGAPTPKTVSDLGQVRGLSPEEPTKQGSYYAAAVASFGHKYDLNAAQGSQKVTTFAVALSSPLPKIDIPVAGKNIRLLPFGKSVKWHFALPYHIDPDQGSFQPTDQIADFYVSPPLSGETRSTSVRSYTYADLQPAYVAKTYGRFRVNFEDHEQGNDFDMDALVTYEYFVENASNVLVTDPTLGDHVRIKLTAESASGSILQHMGYVISGTEHDGPYLEVMDSDSEGSYTCNDTDYFLDTPPGQYPGGTWADGQKLPPTATPGNCGPTPRPAITPFSTERTLRPGTNAPANYLHDPLWYAAKWGGFMDYDGDGLPDRQDEWDADGDGDPDTYFYVQNPLYLEQQLDQSFRAILERASAGTAASVISSTRAGEGAVYQAVFYPRYLNTVSWAGEVHALLVDAYGNMREDTNGNQTLDLSDDYIVQFSTTSSGEVLKYRDTNGDGQLTDTEKSGQTPVSTTMNGLTYLWRSTPWLNGISDTNVVLQRTYASTEQKRYIFTFIDADNDMVADTGEVVDFDNASSHDATIKPYVHLWDPFDPPTWKNDDTKKNQGTRNQIDYIRGLDRPTLRSRRYIDTATGTTKTYRLGDVVHSTPTAVGRPAENYDLLYRDESYRSFFTKYRNRRTVVYAGGNDGMLHAFNGGFPIYNPSTRAFQFATQSQGGSETQFQLGAEMWAYVPFNLIPHLYWLTRMDYHHVYYCDLKPRVLDARVYDPTLPDTDVHPKGWATLLVGGMRFGGGRIRTDADHDGVWAAASDKTLKSAYFILDITNPEAAPKLLAEISLPELGYTTGSPAVAVVKDTSSDTPNNWYLVLGTGPNGMRLKYIGIPATPSANWKILGRSSGALATTVSWDTTNQIVTLKDVIGTFQHNERVYRDANNNGLYDTGETYLFTTDLNSSSTVVDLTHGASSQQAGVYMIDLVQLARYGNLKDQGGNTLVLAPPSGPSAPAQRFDTNAFVSDLVAVDLDLDYKADAVYFGTVSGSPGSWAGKLRRLVLNDPDTGVLPATPSTWVKDSTLINVGKPVTAAPAVAMDPTKQTWIFFGTGRYLNLGDATDTSQQAYYGVKEPWTDSTTSGTAGMVDINLNTDADADPELTEMTWGTVATSDLLDVSRVVTFEGGTIKCDDGSGGLIDCANISDLNSNGKDDFNDLLLTIRGDATRSPALAPKAGWYLDFANTRERNIGQAALLGGLLTFTSYIPDSQQCADEGTGDLWALYYETGSAYPSKSVLGFGERSITEDAKVKKELNKTVGLGKGLATSPNIHTGRETGSKAYVQTSTGAIVVIGQDNPGATKSGKSYWGEE
jgi:type IV pilus assembly protein PilY1